MPESKQTSNEKLDDPIRMILERLERTMMEIDHKTPTINDIYDTFNSLGLHIDRTPQNSQEIIRLLKYYSGKQINRELMIKNILKNVFFTNRSRP